MIDSPGWRTRHHPFSMARLIDRNGWERWDETVNTAASTVVIRATSLPSTRMSMTPSAVEVMNARSEEILFHRVDWQHADGTREAIYFEDQRAAETRMRRRLDATLGETLVQEQLSRAVARNHERAREACTLAFRLFHGVGELALAGEIAAGKIGEHVAAQVVASVLKRIRDEAMVLGTERCEVIIRLAGIPSSPARAGE